MELTRIDQKIEIMQARHAELLTEAEQRRLLKHLFPSAPSDRAGSLRMRWRQLFQPTGRATLQAEWQVEPTPNA